MKTLPVGDACTLWGGARSPYTGKVRSCLFRPGMHCREFHTFHPHLRELACSIVIPGAAPNLESPAGDTVQDRTDIIEYLDARHPGSSMIPATPLQRAKLRGRWTPKTSCGW